VPGEYLVTLAARADVKAISGLYGRFEITGIRDLGQEVFLVTLKDDPGPAMMEKLRGGTFTSSRFSRILCTGSADPGMPGSRGRPRWYGQFPGFELVSRSGCATLARF